MKHCLWLCVFIMLTNIILAQADTTKNKKPEITTDEKSTEKKKKTWFDKSVKIGQSMEYEEQREEPAQVQFTIPKKDTSSWLINLGVSVKISSESSSLISKLTGEYHKNTLTDKKQDNLSLGYTYSYFLNPKAENLKWFFAGDAKYVYDAIGIKHAIASNLLFTFLNENGKIRWDQFSFFNKKKQSLFVSLFAGSQIQETFKAKSDSSEGFILRPLYTFTTSYNINSNEDKVTPQPRVRFSLSYTGRYDLANSTDNSENYTYLLKTGAELFFAYKPVRVSLGCSFNYGSDPVQGLPKQQFWLISLNVHK